MGANIKADRVRDARVEGRARENRVLQSGARRDSGAVPWPAKVLGAMGLLPFVALGAALWFASPARLEGLANALTGYAAIILAFMGAVYWGLAIGSPGPQRHYWYALGVVPALTGWFATSLSPGTALTVLAVAFVGVFALDLMAIEARLAPPWYRKLRQPLTAVVVATLALGACGVWFSAT